MWTGCWITYVHKTVLHCYSLNISSLGGTTLIIAQLCIARFPACAADTGYKASLCFTHGAFCWHTVCSRAVGIAAAQFWKLSWSATASRYCCKVCNLFLYRERRSRVMDTSLKKKKTTKQSAFSCIPDSGWREKFEVKCEPQSGDSFVMEKIQLRKILDSSPRLRSSQSI